MFSRPHLMGDIDSQTFCILFNPSLIVITGTINTNRLFVCKTRRNVVDLFIFIKNENCVRMPIAFQNIISIKHCKCGSKGI